MQSEITYCILFMITTVFPVSALQIVKLLYFTALFKPLIILNSCVLQLCVLNFFISDLTRSDVTIIVELSLLAFNAY